jgi:hypothetical protein
MAENVPIDPDLLDRAFALSGERTREAAIARALEEYIARRERMELLALMGTLEWDEAFDYKAARTMGR